MRKRHGFTLIELLTVAFIIAVLVAMMLPAIQGYRRKSLRQRTENSLLAIKQGLDSYKQDFGDYPPSEPDRVNWEDGDVKALSWSATWTGGYHFEKNATNNITGFHGAAALVLYLNGRGGNGYKQRHDTTNWSGAGNASYERERSWPMRVQDVKVSDRSASAPRGGWYGTMHAGFLDSWGNEIEYFRAYRNRGDTAARIFPRAVNVPLNGIGPGSGDYRYVFPETERGVVGGYVVGGYEIRVPATGWSNATYSDYRSGWPYYAAPVNSGNFLVVSPGPDSLFGSDDDLGNW